LRAVVLGLNDNNNRFNINANNNINNNRPARGMICPCRDTLIPQPIKVKTYKNLWSNLCSMENLELAYRKAKRHKSRNPRIIEFEKHWQLHLCILHKELITKAYKPMPLRKFVLRDPKTRIICVSDFRDRIVHHALVNVLRPIFEPRFIHDSYASRKGKGTLAAIERFDEFKRRLTRNGKLCADARNNNDVIGYVLKADIRHYFPTVDHDILLNIIYERVKDDDVRWLTKTILDNYETEEPNKGMPLGNWTSQFFANIYLNELDQFVKHTLRAKHYIRYVDDFVIMHESKSKLQEYEVKIKEFLNRLKLELHPDKCSITPLRNGVSFLGFKIFYHHKIVRKRNLRKIKNKLAEALAKYKKGIMSATEVTDILNGWSAYAMQGNTYQLREKLNSELVVRLKNASIYRR